MTKEECKHDWVSNSGNGSLPKFKNGMFGQHQIMHVRCCKCGDRTWLTETQWDEFLTPNAVLSGAAKK